MLLPPADAELVSPTTSLRYKMGCLTYIVCLMQELELANRYISTLDALLAGAPGSSIGRHVAASLAGTGSTDRSSTSATAAATAAAAAAAGLASDPATAGSLGGMYGSLGLASAALEAQIKRTLDGQAARAEAAEVGQPDCKLIE